MFRQRNEDEKRKVGLSLLCDRESWLRKNLSVNILVFKKYSRHILGPETAPNCTLLFVESLFIFRWQPFSVGFQLNKSKVHHSHSISRWHAVWQSFSVIASGSGILLISFPEYAVLISTHPVWDKILLQMYLLLFKKI